jgi:cytochrome c553
MKPFWSQLPLQTAILTIVLSIAAATDTTAFSQKDLQAKTEYCSTCHGLSGQGYRGWSPMPRLAGQQPDYFEGQLRAFVERRRRDKEDFLNMAKAHDLSPEMGSALAAHFRGLHAKPLGGARRELVVAGKKIFEEGIPGATPPCYSCHGPDARGNGEFPSLAGQLHDYIQRTLVNWDKQRGQDAAKPDKSAIMKPIARSMTETNISAVAAYLSQLE